MDENKNFDEFEEFEENIEETEDVIEETEDVIEEVTDEEPVDAEPLAEPLDDILQEPEEIKKGSKTGVIIAVIVAVIVIAAAVITSQMETNPYNKMGYVDISGKTVQDLCDAQGIEVAEFLKNYGLPEDMPANTTEAAAYYTIPTSKMAEMYGMDFAKLKEMLKLPDTVTEDTPWGEAEGQIRVGDYVGEEGLDEFKKNYGLGDEVTADTLWKEIRNTVDLKQKADREAKEAEEAKNAQNSDANEEQPAGDAQDGAAQE